MLRRLITDRMVFCCMPQEYQEQIKAEADNGNLTTVYSMQKIFEREKTGYRCRMCGKLHPYLQLQYQDQLTDPNKISKMKGKCEKYRKAAALFYNDHYYARLKNTLLKFQLDAEQNMQQTDVIPIMGETRYIALSPDEKYMATATQRGTVAVMDLGTKQILAKKQKSRFNGTFIFTQAHELLYFWKDAIRCWDFLADREEILWNVPADFKISDNPAVQIHVYCNNVIYHNKRNAYLFQCMAGMKAYIVSIKDMAVDEVVQLPPIPTLSKLVYMEGLDQYTLPIKDKVMVLDQDYHVVEDFAAPNLIQIMNGGGVFPICRYESSAPYKVFLSPDGKWLLLKYSAAVILMKREDYEMKYCLFSYAGRTVHELGFVDNTRFWYVCGDTTCVQEIAE